MSVTLALHLYNLYKAGDGTFKLIGKSTVKLIHPFLMIRDDIFADYDPKSSNNEFKVDLSDEALTTLIHYLYLDAVGRGYYFDVYCELLNFVLNNKKTKTKLIGDLCIFIIKMMDEMQDPGNSNPDGKIREILIKHGKDKRIEKHVSSLLDHAFMYTKDRIPLFSFELKYIGVDKIVDLQCRLGDRILSYVCTNPVSKTGAISIISEYMEVDPELKFVNLDRLDCLFSTFTVSNIPSIRFLLSRGIKIPYRQLNDNKTYKDTNSYNQEDNVPLNNETVETGNFNPPIANIKKIVSPSKDKSKEINPRQIQPSIISYLSVIED